MKRKIYSQLLDWKQNSKGKVALLIEGARRIGKSYIVEEFARNEYSSYLLIDFSKVSPKVKALFDEYLEDIDMLLSQLQIYYKKKLTPRLTSTEIKDSRTGQAEAQSLIIFDEIQFCPRARQAIKFLVADRRFDYIETGSLISIKANVKDIMIPSEERAIEMFPMDFEEFLWAMGNDMLMPHIKQQFKQFKPMAILHRQAMEYFRQYMIVGGMPQAVYEYVSSKDFDKVDAVKRDIINLYRNDIRKYADKQELKVTAIFDEIPSQLQKHEKKFKLVSLNENARMRDYADAFFWLSDAKIINCCYNSTAPNIGLKLNQERSTLKCYMGDTGLLISLAFDEHGGAICELYKKLMFDKLEVNSGMLVENVVAQMLRAAKHQLYFFSNSSRSDATQTMEIDFLISKPTITSRHNISPIEVKSSKNYTLTSLRKCMKKYKNQLATAYVLHDGDLKVEEEIVFMPLYMAGLL